MAGDRIKYERALRKWDALKEAKQLSAPEDLGSTAVLHSLRRTSIHDTEQDYRRAIESFREEAHSVAEEVRAIGLRATVLSGINYQTMASVIKDRDYSSIVLIGYGSFSSVNQDNAGVIEWWNVANMVSHLKTGLFVQRFCGHYIRPLAVPLGAFAVSDHRNILAPPGMFFDPVAEPNDERLLRPVARHERMTSDYIKHTFSIANLDIEEEEDPPFIQSE